MRNQAPYYAKVLPQLPRLIHERLQGNRLGDRELLEQWVVEQRRTNALLRVLIYLGLGFVASLLFFQVLIHSTAFY